MNIPAENLNRYMWYGVAAMVAIYIIIVLEDIVEALRKRDVIVLKVIDGIDAPPVKVIENAVPIDNNKEPSIDWTQVT